MTALDSLRRVAAEQSRDRLLVIGAAVSAVWLVLVGLFVWLSPGEQPHDAGDWLFWLLGVVLPLALIWVAVFSARSLVLLRQEAEDLRASLHEIRAVAAEPGHQILPRKAPAPRTSPPMTARRADPPPVAETGQAVTDHEGDSSPELTPTELFLALNFPDGPDDAEAIRCLRLALGDPARARLIRAAQDVVTLLAAQGVYMDDLDMPETDPALWQRFAAGHRGADVAGLAVIEDQAALATAAGMLRGDEIFRDVAHHFMRHFDGLLTRRAQIDEPMVLAVLAESRSGRAFLLLAQASGILTLRAEEPASGA